jgi:hypothetical protein
MNAHVIRCGCGRVMAAEARRGAGAYRCGCGMRIMLDCVAPPPDSMCVVAECLNTAIDGMTVRLCREHRTEVVNELAPLITRRQGWLATYGPDYDPQKYQTPKERSDYDRRPDPVDSFVYFIQRERLIKIGFSVDPVKRAGALNAVVLATIPGERHVERATHLRFAHLRQYGEWFEPGPDLLAYINELRLKLQQPAIQA